MVSVFSYEGATRSQVRSYIVSARLSSRSYPILGEN
jgi:hypothetical protein